VQWCVHHVTALIYLLYSITLFLAADCARLACSDICISDGGQRAHCLCRAGYILNKTDNATCFREYISCTQPCNRQTYIYTARGQGAPITIGVLPSLKMLGLRPRSLCVNAIYGRCLIFTFTYLFVSHTKPDTGRRRTNKQTNSRPLYTNSNW